MKDNKLLTVLKLLSPADCKRLKDFAHSPYFNKNETILKLLNYLLSHAPEWKAENIKDEKVWEVVYPQKMYDKTAISKLRYKAFLVVEKFLVQKQIEQKPQIQQVGLLEFYADNALGDLYEETCEKIAELQKKETYQNSNFHYHEYLIVKSISRFHTQFQQRSENPDFEKTDIHLTTFFISQKLENACNSLTRSKVVATSFQPELLEEVLFFLEKNPQILAFPAVKVYYHLYKMLKYSENVVFFYDFQQLLPTQEQYFSPKELRNLYSYLRNYCISKINVGDTSFEEVLFWVYDTQLKAGWLFDEAGKLYPSNFKNIVVLALRLEKMDWTADFLKKYTTNLPEESRMETHAYCLAKLFFAEKKYNETLKLLCNVDFEDIFFKIGARKLLLQTYYELGEWEGLNNTLNSFRVFLHRDKTIAESHKIANRNFLNMLRKLSDILPDEKEEWLKFREQVEMLSPLGERNWLLKKIERFL